MTFLATKVVFYHSRPHHYLLNVWTFHWFLPKTFKSHVLLRLSSFHSTTMKHHDSILKGKYPAKAHCAKVAASLKATVKDESPARIYLQGQRTRMIEDNDEPQPFRSDYLVARAQVSTDFHDSDNVVTSFTSLAVICPTAISSTTSLPPPSPSSSPLSILPPSSGPAFPYPQSRLYTSTTSITFALHLNSTTTSHPPENQDHPHP